jgi:polysaccharide biosynthesis protein PslG
MIITVKKFKNSNLVSTIIKRILLTQLILINCQNAVGQAFPVNTEIPNNLGVNIHFTHPRPGEMSQLASSGVRWIRMDFDWRTTELKKGVYDFSSYENLIKESKKYNIKILFILGYVNSLYDKGLSPYTYEGRKAFGNWVAAAVKKFQKNNIIWELYNEPNLPFWSPKPNVDHYILLAKEVGKVIHRTSSSELFVGPAVSRIDFTFLEACFKANLLKQWSAISVHPYRTDMPETVTPEYQKLRQLIAKYVPKGKKVPILSGEWGYTSRDVGLDLQGKYLARQWLINLSNDIPLSIWYDWQDDGSDPKNGEHNFGIVYFNDSKNSLYSPKVKPAFLASKTLISTLSGLRFYRKLYIKKPSNYVLIFKKANKIAIAAWTTSLTPQLIKIPINGNLFKTISYLGAEESVLQNKNGFLSIKITDSVKYIVPIR